MIASIMIITIRQSLKMNINKTQILFIASSLLTLLVVVLLTAGQSDKQTKQQDHVDATKVQGAEISESLETEEIKALAGERGFQRFFWLGPPTEQYQVRMDLADNVAQTQIGYLDAASVEKFNEGTPEFTALVVTRKFNQATPTQEIVNTASAIIDGQGFKVYLPPENILRQRGEAVALSDDRRLLAFIVSGDDDFNKSKLLNLAARVQLTGS